MESVSIFKHNLSYTNADIFKDVDECMNLDVCNDGKCNNTIGSFECLCDKGFRNRPGDKKTCEG